MAGTLYIVATPIGNLDDITKRAIDTLNLVDFIVAEDTRVTLKLLNYLNIKKKLISYHKYNIKEREQFIIDELKNGRNIALVSDAGTPLISDPGEEIVKRCHMEGIKVTAVPGACALILGLIMSGISSQNFVFEGFLPKNKRAKMEKLNELKSEKRTIILYEAPHKLIGTLELIKEIFGENRVLSLVKEITKIHENVIIGEVGEIIKILNNDPPKGEYVVVIEGEKEDQTNNKDKNAQVEEMIEDLKAKGLSSKEITSIVSKKLDIPKNQVYKMVIKTKG